MLFLALAGIMAVGLAFAELRLLAVLGLAVLLFLNPLLDPRPGPGGGRGGFHKGDRLMDYEDYIPEALDLVLAWDLPEEALAEALNEQARLMVLLPERDWQSLAGQPAWKSRCELRPCAPTYCTSPRRSPGCRERSHSHPRIRRRHPDSGCSLNTSGPPGGAGRRLRRHRMSSAGNPGPWPLDRLRSTWACPHRSQAGSAARLPGNPPVEVPERPVADRHANSQIPARAG